MELILLIGIPASGKSTFYKSHFNDFRIISKDLMGGKHKQKKQIQLLREALSMNQDVVIDNCNVLKEDRKAIIEIGKEFGATIFAYYFPPNPELSLIRNSQRKNSVPGFVIWMKNKELQIPRMDEGFDRLFVVKAADMVFDLEEIFSEI